VASIKILGYVEAKFSFETLKIVSESEKVFARIFGEFFSSGFPKTNAFRCTIQNMLTFIPTPVF